MSVHRETGPGTMGVFRGDIGEAQNGSLGHMLERGRPDTTNGEKGINESWL